MITECKISVVKKLSSWRSPSSIQKVYAPQCPPGIVLTPTASRALPQNPISTLPVFILPNMTDEIVVSEESDYCEACNGGWGHEVDMTDGYECKFFCRTCLEELVVHAKQDEWCCEHRYVGEDLWRAEKYHNTWDCPECGGEHMQHDTSCSMSSESDEDDEEDVSSD